MRFKGRFKPPGDKSVAHRLALMALLAEGETRLGNMPTGRDVRSSLAAAGALGVGIRPDGEWLVLTGAAGKLVPSAELDCGNSGTTMRLLMGLLAGRPGVYRLDGDGSLRRRPMERLAAPLRSMGAEIDCTRGRCPVRIKGKRLNGIDYTLPVASAQMKSALLLAGLQADGPTILREPGSSRDHTEQLIGLMGGSIESGPAGIKVGRSPLRLPERIEVPGDPSSAAFFLTAAAMSPGSDLTADRVLLNPTRTGFLAVLARMGADVETKVFGSEPEPWGSMRVCGPARLTGTKIDAAEIPGLIDEVPILALAATQARGVTIIEGAGELRLKETDRLAAVTGQLGRLGGDLRAEGDRLTITGPTRLSARPKLDSLGDHRMAMTLRLALGLAGADLPIAGEECTAVSYPGFHDELARLCR